MERGVKKLDEWCKNKDYSIKINRQKKVCGLRKNDYLYRGDKYD